MVAALAVGVEARYYGKLESSFGSSSRFAGTDALSMIDLEFEPDQKYVESKERRGTASRIREIRGKFAGKWTGKFYVQINALGTAPHGGVFYQAAFGQAPTIVAATSVAYALGGIGTTPPTLQLARHVGASLYEVVNGAVVEDMQVECVGNGESMITVSGAYSRHGWCYGSALSTGTISSGAGTCTLASPGLVGPGACVKIGTDDNSGAGYLVSAVDPVAGTVTFAPNIGTTQTGATLLAPFSPTPSYSGEVEGAINCGLSVGGNSIGMISGKIAWKTGHHLLDKEATSDRPTRASRGKRTLTFTAQVYFLDSDNGALSGEAFNGALYDVQMRIGPNTAASRIVFDFPNARVSTAKIAVAEDGEATWDMKIEPRINAANEDEMTALLN